MEINIKIHVEQPAPHRQRLYERDKQIDRQTNKKDKTFLATLAAGEIRAPPNLAR